MSLCSEALGSGGAGCGEGRRSARPLQAGLWTLVCLQGAEVSGRFAQDGVVMQLTPHRGPSGTWWGISSGQLSGGRGSGACLGKEPGAGAGGTVHRLWDWLWGPRGRRRQESPGCGLSTDWCRRGAGLGHPGAHGSSFSWLFFCSRDLL